MATLAAKDEKVNVITSRVRCYTNLSRVKADVGHLLRSTPYLTPCEKVFTHNDGRSERLLCLEGTVPTTYQGASYHTPVCIWIPPNYPASPPPTFVTPTAEMMIKPKHPHVDAAGMVYMPYLHSWSEHSSNLVLLMGAMGSLFSTAPPLFRRGSGSTMQSLPKPKPATSVADTLKSEVTSKLQAKLHEFYAKTRDEIDAESDCGAMLEAKAKEVKEGVATLRRENQQLDSYIAALEASSTELTSWLEANESKTMEDADTLVETTDVLSAQLIDVVAETAACEDALYHVDSLLENGRITLDGFLKEVRTLARRRFLATALSAKISAAMHRAA